MTLLLETLNEEQNNIVHDGWLTKYPMQINVRKWHTLFHVYSFFEMFQEGRFVNTVSIDHNCNPTNNQFKRKVRPTLLST